MPHRSPTTRRPVHARLAPVAVGIASLVSFEGTASAQSNPAYLQLFEMEWDDIERRTPDIFLAGYGAMWLPPTGFASFQSAGYDAFDRFNLGKPPLLSFSSCRQRTTYGTEGTFDGMIAALHTAGVEVYIDAILNHNSGRTTSDAFLADGGWPGFYIPRENPPRDKQPTDDWGDFHAGNQFGYLQSENPGGGNYNLWDGDLVALVDIDQDDSQQLIRHLIAAGNPNNIPAGNFRNLPDPNNARFYPDTALTPDVFTNPSSNNSGSTTVTRYPFNLADPMSGNPVVERPGELLGRWAQWMVEVKKVDGFRLDASKHTNPFWWDGTFDSYVFMTRTTPDGRRVTPFSFGENTTSNFDIVNNYARRDGFGNRDSLDLNGAGRLREIASAQGFSSWGNLFANADGGHLDQADDGFQNGSLGMNHVFSHDNGSNGDGGSLPGFPTIRQEAMTQHAYLLMRPGRAIVYHHGKGIPRTSGFFPREGMPKALGFDPVNGVYDDTLTTLVRLHNEFAYGQYYQLNNLINDTLIFERATPVGGGLSGNVLVALNDRWDAGTESWTVNTSFPQGTRIHEQTGNAADPMVDPSGVIPEVITVGANGQVNLTVPRNASSAGDHGKGYLIYAPAVPSSEISIVGASGEIPADPASVPVAFRRLNSVPVVTTDTFQVRLDTTQGDSQDADSRGDNALLKIDDGTFDANGNGAIDFPLTASVIGGFEQFVTQNSPGNQSGNGSGVYVQTIDATGLSDGYHFITTIAFRQRPAGTTPQFRESREVVFVNREAPGLSLEPLATEEIRPEFRVFNPDRTAATTHVLVNVPNGVDPVSLATQFNAAVRYDRNQFRQIPDSNLQPGANTVSVVAFEDDGSASVTEFTVTLPGGECVADWNGSGAADIFDILAYLDDWNAQDPATDLTDDSMVNIFDVLEFLTIWNEGCP